MFTPYTRDLKRSVLIVAALVFSATLAAYAVTSLAQKVYTAESMLIVSAGLGTDPTVNGDVLNAPRIAQTYASLATTRLILSQVIATARLATDPEELARLVRVSAEPASPFISIAVTEPDPVKAQATANALADILVKEATVEPSGDSPERRVLDIVERAVVPDEPSGPRLLFNTILAAGTALVLGIVGIVALAYVRSTRSADAG